MFPLVLCAKAIKGIANSPSATNPTRVKKGRWFLANDLKFIDQPPVKQDARNAPKVVGFFLKQELERDFTPAIS
jgi:hypothetical protein